MEPLRSANGPLQMMQMCLYYSKFRHLERFNITDLWFGFEVIGTFYLGRCLNRDMVHSEFMGIAN